MDKKKVVVAFSGGLDTSYTVMRLSQEGYEVHAACANTGGFSAAQLKKNEENAYRLGAKQYVTLDVTQEYYEKSLKYMIFGNVLRNNCYPISVSSERIFQAIAIARYANEIGADAIAHGSTGAGNDQIRFDMTFLVMAPGIEIITLTRDERLTRKEEVDYLNAHGYHADFTKLKYSYNVGIWGTSICGGELLDPSQGLPEEAYLKHVAHEGESLLTITFEKGEISGVNGEAFTDRIKAIQRIEEIGAAYGIGRDCNVGDTIIGIKGRVGFEAAAPKLIIEAHRAAGEEHAEQMAAVLERPGGQLVRHVPAREPVPGARDARHRGHAHQFTAPCQRHRHPAPAAARLRGGGRRLAQRPAQVEARRIRRDPERLECRRGKGIHQTDEHPSESVLRHTSRRTTIKTAPLWTDPSE